MSNFHKWQGKLEKRFPEVVLLGGRYNSTDRVWEEITVWLNRHPCLQKDKKITNFIRRNFIDKEGQKCKKVAFYKHKREESPS